MIRLANKVLDSIAPDPCPQPMLRIGEGQPCQSLLWPDRSLSALQVLDFYTVLESINQVLGNRNLYTRIGRGRPRLG